MKAYFENQTKLLLEVLGTATQDPSFVLKGGTAINFFHTNMPRLSVDIDLAYTKINSRDTFLIENESFFQKLSAELQKKHNLFVKIQRTKEEIPKQINIASQDIAIKIEVNLVLRGTVFPLTLKESCEAIKRKYETQFRVNTLSFEDLYAGKFCAALDRQHPRDLFDVMVFFQSHQITETLKKALIVYMISGGRPISEIISPNRLDQRRLFENEFIGMTDDVVRYEDLEEAREQLVQHVDSVLNKQDRAFFISFKEGKPRWELLAIDHIKDMPAVKWKLYNIAKMEPQKRQVAVNELRRKLSY